MEDGLSLRDHHLLEEAEEWLSDSEFAPARELAQRIKTRLAEEATPTAQPLTS